MIPRLALAAAALALASAEVAAARRTVQYFLDHPRERDIILRECRNDEEAARMPECGNAQRAADQAAMLGLGPHEAPAREAPPPLPRPAKPRTPGQFLTSPQYYTQNPIAREVTLSKCAQGLARAADCRAARAALAAR